jgi:hypothetical protein
MGETISDILLYPSNEVSQLESYMNNKSPPIRGFVPIGRGLAELFEREMSIDNPTVNDLLESFPNVLTNRLNLATDVRVTSSKDLVEIILLQPTLVDRRPKEISKLPDLLYCETCSMVATLVCHVSNRETMVEACERYEESDTSVIRLKLGKEHERRKEQLIDVESDNS